jgi:hypothetical protein
MFLEVFTEMAMQGLTELDNLGRALVVTLAVCLLNMAATVV